MYFGGHVIKWDLSIAYDLPWEKGYLPRSGIVPEISTHDTLHKIVDDFSSILHDHVSTWKNANRKALSSYYKLEESRCIIILNLKLWKAPSTMPENLPHTFPGVADKITSLWKNLTPLNKPKIKRSPSLYDRGFSFFSLNKARSDTPETFTTLNRTPGISPTAWPFRPNPAIKTSSCTIKHL